MFCPGPSMRSFWGWKDQGLGLVHWSPPGEERGALWRAVRHRLVQIQDECRREGCSVNRFMPTGTHVHVHVIWGECHTAATKLGLVDHYPIKWQPLAAPLPLSHHLVSQGPQGLPSSRVEKTFQQLLRTGSQDDGRAGQPSTSRRNAVWAHVSRPGTSREPGTGVLVRPCCSVSLPLSALLEHCVLSWLGPGEEWQSQGLQGGGEAELDCRFRHEGCRAT